MIDTAHARRVRWAVIGHLVLASVLLAVQARQYPEMALTWIGAWACAIVAPAISAELELRRLTHQWTASVSPARLLLAPLVVAWIMLVTLFEVTARLSAH